MASHANLSASPPQLICRIAFRFLLNLRSIGFSEEDIANIKDNISASLKAKIENPKFSDEKEVSADNSATSSELGSHIKDPTVREQVGKNHLHSIVPEDIRLRALGWTKEKLGELQLTDSMEVSNGLNAKAGHKLTDNERHNKVWVLRNDVTMELPKDEPWSWVAVEVVSPNLQDKDSSFEDIAQVAEAIRGIEGVSFQGPAGYTVYIGNGGLSFELLTFQKLYTLQLYAENIFEVLFHDEYHKAKYPSLKDEIQTSELPNYASAEDVRDEWFESDAVVDGKMKNALNMAWGAKDMTQFNERLYDKYDGSSNSMFFGKRDGKDREPFLGKSMIEYRRADGNLRDAYNLALVPIWPKIYMRITEFVRDAKPKDFKKFMHSVHAILDNSSLSRVERLRRLLIALSFQDSLIGTLMDTAEAIAEQDAST